MRNKVKHTLKLNTLGNWRKEGVKEQLGKKIPVLFYFVLFERRVV